MSEYRLYFLDAESHVIARLEFVARNDALASRVAASLAEETNDKHSGYMLWHGARQVFATDEGADSSFARAITSRRLNAEVQHIVLSLEEQLLNSHWCIARSERLLRAASRLKHDLPRAS
jgi:hypothetical protein